MSNAEVFRASVSTMIFQYNNCGTCQMLNTKVETRCSYMKGATFKVNGKQEKRPIFVVANTKSPFTS